MKTMMMGVAASLALVAGVPAAQAQYQSQYQGSAQTAQASTPTSQIEQLHQSLHLSAAQDAAWQLYRSAADIPDRAQARRRAASSLFRTVDSPHRMDLVEAEMRQELDDLQRQSHALKAFYGTLAPDQQRIFDAKTLPPAEGQSQY